MWEESPNWLLLFKQSRLIFLSKPILKEMHVIIQKQGFHYRNAIFDENWKVQPYNGNSLSSLNFLNDNIVNFLSLRSAVKQKLVLFHWLGRVSRNVYISNCFGALNISNLLTNSFHFSFWHWHRVRGMQFPTAICVPFHLFLYVCA